MTKTNLSHLINTHYPECNCKERYLDYGSLGYYVGQYFVLEELSEQSRRVSVKYQKEMMQYERVAISFETHRNNAFEFLDERRNFFNGHFGPLCKETTLIRNELKSIVSLSNSKYLVITTDSEPLGHHMSHQDFIQKPYLGLEVLSNNYEDIIEFVARINDIISTTKYVHLVTNASHDITQSFQTPVFYVSLMFAVTTPEFEPVDSEDTEIHIWKQTFEHMKYRWWKDVYHIIENCVK